jgi:hypothetical protein
LDKYEEDHFQRIKLSKKEEKMLKKRDRSENDIGNIGRDFKNFSTILRENKKDEISELLKAKGFKSAMAPNSKGPRQNKPNFKEGSRQNKPSFNGGSRQNKKGSFKKQRK